MSRQTAAKSPNPQRIQRRRRRLDFSAGGARSSSSATTTVRALAAAAADALPPSPPAANNRKRVVILGGTGRVGASTAAQLAKGPGGDLLDLVLVGKPGGGEETSSSSLSSASPAVAAACKKYPALARAIARVAAVDSGDAKALEELFRGASVVIHCAGPFQSGGAGAAGGGGGGGKGSVVPAPLAAAIKAKVPYVDVCDDPDWAKVRKRETFWFLEREREKRKEKLFFRSNKEEK